MAKVGKLSASKVTCYKGCQLAYFLKYVKHVKVPANVRLVFGKDIHYLSKRFYKCDYKSAEKFANFWKFYWFSDIAGDFFKGKAKKELKITEYSYFVKDKETGKRVEKILRIGNHVNLGPQPVGCFFGYMKVGIDILTRFYNRHKKEECKPRAVELDFGKKKDDNIEIGGHLIRGAFDRIEERKEGIYIIDYKTDKILSNLKPDSEINLNSENDLEIRNFNFDLHRRQQFTIYSWVFRELFGKQEHAILYYHLRSGKQFPTYRSQKDFDYIRKILDEVAEGIEKDKFTPFYDYHCRYCDYKVACEQYAIPYHGGPRIDLEGRIKPVEEVNLFGPYSLDELYDPNAKIPDWMEMQEVE